MVIDWRELYYDLLYRLQDAHEQQRLPDAVTEILLEELPDHPACGCTIHNLLRVPEDQLERSCRTCGKYYLNRPDLPEGNETPGVCFTTLDEVVVDCESWVDPE